MERTTIEITLPDSQAVVTMYENLTSGEYRKMQSIFLSKMQMNVQDAGADLNSKVDASVSLEMQDFTLKCLIKSVVLDGDAIEDIDKFLYDLSIDDGNTLYNKADELTNKSTLNKEQKKK